LVFISRCKDGIRVNHRLKNVGAFAGTPVSSNINPIFFVIGLSGFTVASVGFLLLNQ